MYEINQKIVDQANAPAPIKPIISELCERLEKAITNHSEITYSISSKLLSLCFFEDDLATKSEDNRKSESALEVLEYLISSLESVNNRNQRNLSHLDKIV